MKTLFISLTLLILVSCSSDPAKDDKRTFAAANTAKAEVETFPELEYITDEDFTPPKMVVYKSHQDRYSEAKKNPEDSLAPETLDKNDSDSVPTFAEGEDPIATISSLCYKKDFDGAFALSDKIYPKYKKHPSYWTQLGTCYYFKKEKRKALLFYNKAIEINPDYAPPVNNLAVLFLEQGQDQKALIALKKAAGLNTFSLTPKFNLAHLYLEYGLVDDSLKLFESLYNLNQQDPDVLLGLGNAYLLQGDVENSLKYFRLVPSNYLSRPDVALNFSVALRLTGQSGDASSIFKRINADQLGPYKSYYTRVGQFLGVIQ